MLFNPFKINKALKQAHRYVDEVNAINDELTGIVKAQQQQIDALLNERTTVHAKTLNETPEHP